MKDLKTQEEEGMVVAELGDAIAPGVVLDPVGPGEGAGGLDAPGEGAPGAVVEPLVVGVDPAAAIVAPVAEIADAVVAPVAVAAVPDPAPAEEEWEDVLLLSDNTNLLTSKLMNSLQIHNPKSIPRVNLSFEKKVVCLFESPKSPKDSYCINLAFIEENKQSAIYLLSHTAADIFAFAKIGAKESKNYYIAFHNQHWLNAYRAETKLVTTIHSRIATDELTGAKEELVTISTGYSADAITLMRYNTIAEAKLSLNQNEGLNFYDDNHTLTFNANLDVLKEAPPMLPMMNPGLNNETIYRTTETEQIKTYHAIKELLSFSFKDKHNGDESLSVQFDSDKINDLLGNARASCKAVIHGQGFVVTVQTNGEYILENKEGAKKADFREVFMQYSDILKLQFLYLHSDFFKFSNKGTSIVFELDDVALDPAPAEEEMIEVGAPVAAPGAEVIAPDAVAAPGAEVVAPEVEDPAEELPVLDVAGGLWIAEEMHDFE